MINHEVIEKVKSHESYISTIDNNRFFFNHPKNKQYKLEISVIIFNIGENISRKLTTIG